MARILSTPWAATGLAVLVLATGCGKQKPTRSATQESNPDAVAQRYEPRSISGRANDTERRAQLLNRIRAADPSQETIVRALLNDKNELGLVLSRRTNMDDVPKLMQVMLAELDKAFPGQDQIVTAYTPTDPPQPIGTARLNARTRDMTYKPAKPTF